MCKKRKIKLMKEPDVQFFFYTDKVVYVLQEGGCSVPVSVCTTLTETEV